VKRWTSDEERILQENYNITARVSLLNLLPAKNWDAIKRKAEKLMLRRSVEERRFSMQDIEYLKENYPRKDTKILAQEMGHSLGTIWSTASKLKIRKIKKSVEVITSPPKVDEIRKASEIGVKGGSRIWQKCSHCGRERWVQIIKGLPASTKCQHCASSEFRGSKNPNWKGGRVTAGNGYIAIKLQPEDFFYPMASKLGYVLEHRLIVAKHLGRCLQPWEKVHHKDGIRDHNTYSNLKLTTSGSHAIEHSKGYRDGYQQGYLDGQNAKLEELRKEIKLLQWQLKEVLTNERSHA